MGSYQDIHHHNRYHTEWYNDKVYSFVRWSDVEKLIVICNFNADNHYGFELQIPKDIIVKWNLKDDCYDTEDQIYHNNKPILEVKDGIGHLRVDLDPLESFILKIK